MTVFIISNKREMHSNTNLKLNQFKEFPNDKLTVTETKYIKRDDLCQLQIEASLDP